jgi:hypothetical protein
MTRAFALPSGSRKEKQNEKFTKPSNTLAHNQTKTVIKKKQNRNECVRMLQ